MSQLPASEDMAAIVQVLQSALIQACIECADLGRARELYHAMRAGGQAPTLRAFNNLINAYGRAMRLGDTAALVKDLVDLGMRPDMRTFAAILGACQRANEPELAFEVYRWGHTPCRCHLMAWVEIVDIC